MISSFFAPKVQVSKSSPTMEVPKRARNEGEESGGKKQKLSKEDELLSYLEEHPTPSGAGSDENASTWRQALSRYTSSPAFARTATFVASERSKHTVFPPPADTFTALNWTPLSDVKIVIVGQDPYHGPSQAHGLSFSVRKGVVIPPSLRNIYKELSNDPNVSNFPNARGMPRHGYLEKWAKQGVLLLNNVLTVRKGEAHSHKKKAGWETFTDQVIRVLAKREDGLVFLLWGKPASEKATNIIGTVRNNNHVVIKTSHPSPLGATKTNSPFMGSKCFSRANEALVEMGHEPIDWNVDDA